MATRHRIGLTLVSALSLALALSACGPSHDEPAREPPPVKDTAFGDMVGTIDKAKGVQDTVDAQKRAMDGQVRANEGDEAP
jgi:hypothetical protein